MLCSRENIVLFLWSSTSINCHEIVHKKYEMKRKEPIIKMNIVIIISWNFHSSLIPILPLPLLAERLYDCTILVPSIVLQESSSLQMFSLSLPFYFETKFWFVPHSSPVQHSVDVASSPSNIDFHWILSVIEQNKWKPLWNEKNP